MRNKDNYKAWDIKLSEYPKKGSIEEKIKFFTKFGILAPSIHNTQPWRFRIVKNTLEIYPDWKYKLQASDVSGSNIYISLGCCVTNIEVIASYFGYQSNFKVLENQRGNLYIKMSFSVSKVTDKYFISLANFITKRFSNKLLYLPRPVPNNVVNGMKKLQIGDLTILMIEDKTIIQIIAKLQGQAAKGVATKDFLLELSRWIRLNKTTKYDGMPGFVEGFKPIKTIIGKVLLMFSPGKLVDQLSMKNEKVLEKSPLVGVIVSSSSNLKTAIDTGRLYEQVALLATSYDLNCTPMHAVIEYEKTLEELTTLLKINKQRPTFLFRLGYSENAEYHTPRRLIEKFYDNK